MWTISLLKRNGWQSVKSHYWTALGVMITMTIISSTAMWGLSIITGITGTVFGIFADQSDIDEELIYSLLGLVIGFVVVVFLISILETGKNRYFYRARRGDVDLGNLFWAFQGRHYTPVMKVMLFRYLSILGWSLLLYIPGIIKYYEYFLVSYLMAENPHLTKERVFEISKATMRGEKLKCFLLQLSFAGWILLIYIGIYILFSAFSLVSIIIGFILLLLMTCVGIYAFLPYYEATMTEFYACMRAKMLAMGITSEEEVTGIYNNYSFNPYQNPYQQNFYQNQNPYQQNPNPYEQQNLYQNPDSEENHKVNLNKDSDDHYFH